MSVIFFPQRNIEIKPLVQSPRKKLFHSTKIVLDMILIERIVVGNPVGKFYVDRRKSGLHQFQIYKKSACPAVSVYERMNRLEFNVKACKAGNRCTVSIS